MVILILNHIIMLHLNVLTILERDLGKLKEEIRLYKNDEDLWKIIPGTSNSGANLALHLAGNLRHFIGGALGNSGYIRDRDAEFSVKGLTRGAIIEIIETTHHEIKSALKGLSPGRLQEDFPKDVGGVKRDTAFVLLHLLGHFSYHLGQINYHRRFLLTQETQS